MYLFGAFAPCFSLLACMPRGNLPPWLLPTSFCVCRRKSFTDMEQRKRPIIGSSSSAIGSEQTVTSRTNPTNPTDIPDYKPEFLHSSVLLTACAPAVCIILAFGGRPALLALCFGSLVSYIFDIMGSVEGTLISILVTGLGLWSTVVWSARLILSESMFNFSVVIVMGVLLFQVFIVICAQFRSLLTEFDSLFYFLEMQMFATMPLLCSATITWFICVEIPSLDFPLCFSTTYFLYVMWMCQPRRSSHPRSLSNHTVGIAGRQLNPLHSLFY